MAQQLTNPDIICSFYSARMEVEKKKLEQIFGVRHGFKYPLSAKVWRWGFWKC
jgi:hypothetical protein